MTMTKNKDNVKIKETTNKRIKTNPKWYSVSSEKLYLY